MWIVQRVGQAAQRQIGSLGHEKKTFVAEPDLTLTVWPETCNRAQQRALANSAWTGDEQGGAANRSNVEPSQEWCPVGPVDIQPSEVNAASPTPNHNPARGAVSRVKSLESLLKAAESLRHSLPGSDVRVRIDNE